MIRKYQFEIKIAVLFILVLTITIHKKIASTYVSNILKPYKTTEKPFNKIVTNDIHKKI